jgi:putative ABC transport system permease protein
MKLYQVVLKDILRRKRRVLYAILGVVIGTMTVVGILTTATAGQEKITAQLEKYGANLSLLPAVKSVDTGLGTLNLGTINVGDNYISEDKIPEIRQITDALIRKARPDIKTEGNISTIAPTLFIATSVKGSSVIIAGIDPVEEFQIKTWWQIAQGKYLDGVNQALLGGQTAILLNLKTGDTLDLNNTTFNVVGILEDSGSDEDYQIFVPLQTLQKAFDKEGMVSSIDVRALCNGCPVETIAGAINQDVSGIRAVAVKQIAANEMGMLEKINTFMLAIAGVTLIVGGFGVFNTLMTSINERKKDIGIMRAVGASRGQIIKALVYEAIVVGAGGGILGYFAGTALAFTIGPIIFEGTAISFVPVYLPLAIGLALFIAVLATLYPAMRATKIKVADSFASL